jgi:hypothetical protein
LKSCIIRIVIRAWKGIKGSIVTKINLALTCFRGPYTPGLGAACDISPYWHCCKRILFLLSLGVLTVAQVTLFKLCTSKGTPRFDPSGALISRHSRSLDSLMTTCFCDSILRIVWLMYTWVAHLLRNFLWLTADDTEDKPGHNARLSDETTGRWPRISHIDVKNFSLYFYHQTKSSTLLKRTFYWLWKHTIFYVLLYQIMFLLAINISSLKCELITPIISVLLAHKLQIRIFGTNWKLKLPTMSNSTFVFLSHREICDCPVIFNLKNDDKTCLWLQRTWKVQRLWNATVKYSPHC